MALRRGSKRALTPAPALRRFRLVRPLLILVPACFVTASLTAQAPAAAGLWRVATATLARPAALEDGPTGSFWNPAADPHGRLTGGAQVIQTSDILGLTGVLVGATYRVSRFGHLGVLLGRMDVRDLVRTTTSPSSEPGGIAVFEQLAGVTLRVNGGPIAAGAALRVHDAQFDADAEGGATIDLGVRGSPLPNLTLAAATHLLAAGFGSATTTDYFAGAQYVLVQRARANGRDTQGIARYGVTVHQSGDIDHELGLGLALDNSFRVDVGLAGEAAFGRRSWRPALALSLRVGRYTLGVARGQGLNDIGATYRVLLDVEVAR